jgi:photosystem II stability/assembly factor-like uncharacterized protein
MRRRLALLAAAGALTLAGCGDDADSSGERGVVVSDAGVQHIHGLGINPADGSLVIATHSGLFRAAAGERRAQRIGDLRQDTMGFTVLGPNRFLGSGHPDLRDDLPPLLGLIRSDDGGRAWKPVSLLGKADFHVLRAAGPWVYGLNSADGALMVSENGGLGWQQRTPPPGLIDLAPQPGHPRQLVAAADNGVNLSYDAGKTWRPLTGDLSGLLAWPRASALHLLDGAGAVHRSSDGGRTWTQVGEIGGRPAAFASHGDDLYAALHTNEVKLSRDGGRTWQLRLAN